MSMERPIPLSKAGRFIRVSPYGINFNFLHSVFGLVLRKPVDKANPEAKQRDPAHNKSKDRSLLKFSQDAKQVEAKAGRISDYARQMQLATGKRGVLIHGKTSPVSI